MYCSNSIRPAYIKIPRPTEYASFQQRKYRFDSYFHRQSATFRGIRGERMSD